MRRVVGTVVLAGALGACQAIYGVSGSDDDDHGTCGGALVCDGFEGALSARWEPASNDGSAELDITMHHGSGSSSLHAQMNALGSDVVDYPGGGLVTHADLVLTGMLYVRLFVFLPSSDAAPKYEQLFTVANFDESLGVAVAVTNDGRVVNNDYADGPFLKSDAGLFMRDQWNCFQLAVPSGTMGNIALSLNSANPGIDVETGSAHVTAESFVLGVSLGSNVSEHGGLQGWFDDVIIDARPTSCDE